MLVLSRKCGQKIIINDNIEIVIVESSFSNVKIGINAPKEISVFREEIWKEIKEANAQSNETSCEALDELTNIIKTNSETKNSKLKNIVNKIQI